MKYEEKYLREAQQVIKLKAFDSVLKTGWRSPSNIALIKYWGKKERQIPLNPSLSITLQNSCSETVAAFTYAERNSQEIQFSFDGKPNAAFSARIADFLKTIQPFVPFIQYLDVTIDSRNSFPHSSGIASSASAMSSIALCLLSAETELFGTSYQKDDFFTKASFMARLGSGSAARSLFPGYAIWGEHKSVTGSNNETGVQCGSGYHASFDSIYDAVLIVNPEKKKVSSSAGHRLMDNHPYRKARIAQANKHIRLMHLALKHGNWSEFVRITELEAMTLHSLMMSSDPGYILIMDKTVALIEEIRDFRSSTGIPVCFSLDAGPNIHLLYPSSERNEVVNFIITRLTVYCHKDKWIDDNMGPGPERFV